MQIREEMNRLAREIVSSCESCVEGVTKIRRETQARLQGLDQAHNAVAQLLRAELHQAEAALDHVEAARRQDEEAQRARERVLAVARRSACCALLGVSRGVWRSKTHSFIEQSDGPLVLAQVKVS